MRWPFTASHQQRTHSIADMAASNSEFARFLDQLGWFPNRPAAIEKLLTSLKTSITTCIPDFTAFQTALADAAVQLEKFDGACDPADRELLEHVRDAGDNSTAVLTLLNRNPLTEFLPFVERVPVRKQGETLWVAPVQNALVLKAPADPDAFSRLLGGLETHFIQAHPSIDDSSRTSVLDAIHRTRRELKREHPYLPRALANLEQRLTAYAKTPLKPAFRKSVETITFVADALQEVYSGSADKQELRNKASEAAELYLKDPNLHCAFLTNRLLETLLHPDILNSTGLPFGGPHKALALIRSEISGGHYGASELALRLRRLEQQGLYFSTFVYALLARADGQAAPTKTRAKIAGINGPF